MRLSARCLKTNIYTQYYEDAEEGEAYAFWRIIEHTGAGWFPWPTHYRTKEEAERRIKASIAEGREALDHIERAALAAAKSPEVQS